MAFGLASIVAGGRGVRVGCGRWWGPEACMAGCSLKNV
jgi:hypothetical protein